MSTTDEIILLTDEFTGLEYSWKKTGVADSTVNNVLTKNIGNYKYERILTESVDLLNKSFAANESLVVDVEPFGFGSTLGTLMIQNGSGAFAVFLWQRNISSNAKTGYFKSMINDLGVTVVHNNGTITVTNGGVAQHLKAELKV